MNAIRFRKLIISNALGRFVGDAACFVLISVFFTAGASAQLTRLSTPISRSDVAYSAGNPLLSYEILHEYIEGDSASYDALWRSARAAVQVGMERQGSREQNQWLDPAIRLSELAITLRPDGIEGLYWHGFAAGRRAMNASASYAVALAQIVHQDAHDILASDSLHGGAHNMLGKLNYEVMSLSWFERTIAKMFMGNKALDDTSWQNAEYHLAKAVDIWPDLILFHFDMGQLHRKRGRREEAIASFRQVLSLGAVHPIDIKLQDQAREILNDWGMVLRKSFMSSMTTGQ
tara:strand:- start:981 stop:1847 length:867 start_codon:yes stop_codon:yes gene_type:complete